MNNQPPANQNAFSSPGFAQPPPQIAQRPPMQYIKETAKKIKYRASTPPPPDDSDDQRIVKKNKNKLLKRVKNNQQEADKLLAGLKLPDDEDQDDDQEFKQKLRDIDQSGKAQKEHDLQRKNYYDERIQQVEERGTKATKLGRRLAVFRSGVKIMLLYLRASKRLRQNRIKNQSLIADGLKIYTQVLKNKFIHWFKVPLSSIISDKKVNFNLTGNDGLLGTSKRTLQNRFVSLKVRLRSIMNILFENTTTFSFSKTVLRFLSQLIKEKAYIPMNFFSQYEKANLQFDNDGALKFVTDSQAQLLLAQFIITKVLIRHIFLKPEESGMPANMKQQTKRNFKILGSVMYYALFSAISQMMPGRKSDKDIQTDGVLDLLVPMGQLIVVFQDHSQWVFQLTKDFEEWIQRILTVVRTHQEEEQKIRESLDAPDVGQIY